MRSLFILLLIINLSYLIWGVAFSEKNEPLVVELQPKGQSTLTLLSERPDNISASLAKKAPAKKIAKKSKPASSKTEVKKISSPSKACYSLGPILDEDNSKKLEQRLKQNGFEPKHKAITDKEPKSYWVYFPAEKTLQAAKAVVNQLETANVNDYFIIRKGKYTNAISLGLYNGYSRAKIRVNKLKKLGFDAKVQTRYHQVTRHWLDFEETSNKPLKDSVWDKIEKDNSLQKIARPCIEPLPKNS